MQDAEDRRVIVDYIWKQVHGSNCLFRHVDGEEKPSKKSKKESTQGTVAILKAKGPRLWISQFRSKEVYSSGNWANETERFGGTSYKILRTHLVRNSNSGKKWAISGRYPKR